MRGKITYGSQGREDKTPKMATPVTDLEKDVEEYTSTVPAPLMSIKKKKRNVNTFKEYISVLEIWEQQFLRNIHHTGKSLTTLKVHLQLADKIWLVTDGGVAEEDGYFGW
eukprot:477123-Ditylum_brightwellii.AAC.1